MTTELKICVLIPCYNEEVAIGGLVRGVLQKNLPVIVIDDGSVDDTVRIAREAGAEVIAQERNFGKGHTLKNGIEHLIKTEYDGVLMMDGDGQHSVEDIDAFLNEAKKHPDQIINGNRMAHPQGMPLIRIWTNKFMSMIISWAAHCRIPDTQCGYRYIGINVLRAIQLRTEGFEIETEILIRASKKGFQVSSVPIRTIYGNEASSIRPFKDTLKFIVYYVKELFRST